MNWKRIAIWSVGGLLVLCVACGILGALLPESENGETVAEIEATNTPEPTEEPTEIPTEEPAPPTPEADPAVAAYSVEVVGHMRELPEALGALGTLMSEPQVGDNNWTIQVGIQLAAIQYAHEQLSEVKPPEDMQDVHDSLLNATQDCHDMTFALSNGIDNGDMADIERAGELMQECTTKFNETTELIADLQST